MGDGSSAFGWRSASAVRKRCSVELSMEKSIFNEWKKQQPTDLSRNQLEDLIWSSTLNVSERNTLAAFVTVAAKEASGPTEQDHEEFWLSIFGSRPWVSFFGLDYWPSTKAVSIEAGISHRTAVRRIHALVDHGVLIPKHPANSYVPGFGFRNRATYIVNLRALSARNMEL
jgi:hypothetical protein